MRKLKILYLELLEIIERMDAEETEDFMEVANKLEQRMKKYIFTGKDYV